MATTRNQPEPEVTKRERAEALAREAIAGHPDGAVRRIILYVVLALSMAAGALFTPLLMVGAVAFVLLLATDGGL